MTIRRTDALVGKHCAVPHADGRVELQFSQSSSYRDAVQQITGGDSCKRGFFRTASLRFSRRIGRSEFVECGSVQALGSRASTACAGAHGHARHGAALRRHIHAGNVWCDGWGVLHSFAVRGGVSSTIVVHVGHRSSLPHPNALYDRPTSAQTVVICGATRAHCPTCPTLTPLSDSSGAVRLAHWGAVNARC
jgi:hypothetical protein